MFRSLRSQPLDGYYISKTFCYYLNSKVICENISTQTEAGSLSMLGEWFWGSWSLSMSVYFIYLFIYLLFIESFSVRACVRACVHACVRVCVRARALVLKQRPGTHTVGHAVPTDIHTYSNRIERTHKSYC